MNNKKPSTGEIYQILFNSIDEGFVVTELVYDEEGSVSDLRIIDANPAFEKHSGFSREKFIGKLSSGVLPLRKGLLSTVNDVLTSGKGKRLRYFSETLRRWFELYIFPLPQDHFTGWLFSDITSRIQEEAEIREKSIRYSALLNATINGVAHCRVITDENGVPVDYLIIEVNNTYTVITGIRKEDIEGKTAREVFPGIEKFSFDYIGEYGKVALHGTELNFETFFEGTKQWLSIYVYSPLPGEFTAIFTDITKKRLEESIRDQERQLLKVILDSIPVMITIYKPDVTKITVNRELEKLTGWTQEMIDRGNVMEMVYPDPERRKIVTEFMKSGSGWLDVKMTRADGSTFETSWANIKIPDGRQVGIGLDITERKKAEEEIRIKEEILQAFFERSPGILNLFDKDLRYLNSDPATPTYFNLNRQTIIGRSVYDLNPSFAEEVLDKILKKVINSGEAMLNIEVEGPIPSRNNEIGWWLVSYFPVSLPGGNDGLGVMGIDITYQKMTEEALRKSEEDSKRNAEELRKANLVIKKSLAEKEFLMKEIHHRVKNNLQIISSLLRLQMDRFEDEKMKIPFIEGANRIRAISIIHEKLYSENIKIVEASSYVPELVTLIANTYEGSKQGINVEMDVSGVALEIDNAVYIGLLLNEILSNAYKHAFTETGRGKIKVELKQLNESEYELIIADNGRGIPADLKPGLGTVLIETLVEQLEGKAEIINKKGTEYKIRFRNKAT
jgi:PAS domain S-box-containing protein